MNFYKQQGVVIVIVLLMILLISTASLVAIKNSQVSTKVISALHVNQLLTLSSDRALAQFENDLDDPVQYSLLTSTNGPIGYLSQNQGDYINTEYVICYQPTKQPFKQPTNQAHLYSGEGVHKINLPNGDSINSQGFCQISNDLQNSYNSSRKMIATQLAFVRPHLADSNSNMSARVEDLKEGETLEDIVPSFNDLKLINPSRSLTPTQALINNSLLIEVKEPVLFRLYITSIIPSMGDASLKEIESCMAQPILSAINLKNSTEGQLECLDRTRTPYDVQFHDFWYALDRKLNIP